MRNIITLASVLAILAVSCGKTTDEQPPFDNVVRVSPDVSAMTRGYHVDAGTIQDFDLMVRNHHNSRYSYTNTRFTPNSNRTEWTPESMMLWESQNAVVDFLAVSPSISTKGISLDNVGTDGSTIFEFEVESNQTKESRKSDLLTYYGYGCSLSGENNTTKIDTDDAGKMRINFSHALCLFQVELNLGTEFNHNGIPEDCPITNLTVDGTVLEGKYVWNLETYAQGFRAEAKAGVTPSKIMAYPIKWEPANNETKRSQAVFECILIPQLVTHMRIDFILNGKPYTYTHGGDINPSYGGISMLLPLTVGKDEVILGGEITASPWVDGGSKDIETD